MIHNNFIMNHKRLAPKMSWADDDPEPTPKQIEKEEQKTNFSDIYISDYTPKSFIVLGNTLSHANNLRKLGGDIKQLNNMGQQWLFAGYRKASVQKYIDEGVVEPAKWSGESKKNDKVDLNRMFEEFKNAFDKDSEYTGESIIEVIESLKQKYNT